VTHQWDAMIIGSGPGGYVAAIRAAQLGLKTAIVEREHIGGVCLNWGCIPTKALIHGVSLYRNIKEGRMYGVLTESAHVDLPALVRQSRSVSSRVAKGVEFLLKKNGIHVIRGSGKLVDVNTISVEENGNTELHSTRGIILATGGRSKPLPGIDRLGTSRLTIRQAMTPECLPESLLIIGAGAIGVEFAYIYAALGVKVTIVEMLEQLLPTADPEISAELHKAFRRLKIDVLTSTRLSELNCVDGCVQADLLQGETPLQKNAEKVLVAIGVDPNSGDIGLQENGITLHHGFVTVNDRCHTGVADVYAVGDLVGGPLLAHKASAEGIVAAESLAGGDPLPIRYETVPACCYCEPQVAQVGATEEDLKQSGKTFRVGRFPFAGNSKATATGHRLGLVKLLFSAEDDTLLGAHIIGHNASEMISELAVCMVKKITGHMLGRIIHPHPSLSESIMEAAEAAGGTAIHV